MRPIIDPPKWWYVAHPRPVPSSSQAESLLTLKTPHIISYAPVFVKPLRVIFFNFFQHAPQPHKIGISRAESLPTKTNQSKFTCSNLRLLATKSHSESTRKKTSEITNAQQQAQSDQAMRATRATTRPHPRPHSIRLTPVIDKPTRKRPATPSELLGVQSHPKNAQRSPAPFTPPP